ncbi:MAG TPA: 2-C-methyl-D-erythritol 2,4-cyclodiphosphate synthase [Bacteroidales bacterium]|nr:2-C-methyl-D-erythritol 2,4-cyclodiphosphate synthase [Bacteroidales bacterium]
MDFRIGFGYDVHRLQQGLPFWLGGVHIEHTKGSLGHSDGDALIHAICDAMLGAANLGDIGVHFPDTDPTFKGIDSKILLRKTMEIIAQKGYSIGNIDSTIGLQRPKVKDFIPQMQAELAKVLDIHPQQISIKVTTTEKLGFVGREEGVSAYAVVLLKKD